MIELFMISLFASVLFAIWGSFLNMIGYRLIHDDISFSEKRSCCPTCKHPIVPYDLIPIISWLLLRGKCRTCKQSISFLYPAIEFITIITFLLLLYQYTLTSSFFAYTLLFSGLIVTIRTDLDQMLISPYATWALVPFGWLFSYYSLLPITLAESLFATATGYALLWLVNTIYKTLKKMDGIGAGDFDLLALVGAWTGFLGLWATITIGALTGSIVGIMLIIGGRDKHAKIPFGPFLALGTILFVLHGNHFLTNCNFLLQ